MLTFPNGKLNIGLHVISKRADGFHNLETIFYPFKVYDALEVTPADKLVLQQFGIEVKGEMDDHLCIKAYNLLRRDFPHMPPVDICLLKAIPVGAGLGGGSANAAFMLCMLNKLFELNLTEQALLNYALQLGSDCPFFIINKPCYATGRGEALTPVDLDLSAYSLMVVNPGIHVSTKEAFAGIASKASKKDLKDIIQQNIYSWKTDLQNDFERSVFKLYPAIQLLKEQLYAMGAIYASMTGSGSSVFAIFEKNALPKPLFPENYICITTP